MAFIALFLIFRFVSISNNISLQRGIVRSVSATEHNDIVIELENDSFYFILYSIIGSSLFTSVAKIIPFCSSTDMP